MIVTEDRYTVGAGGAVTGIAPLKFRPPSKYDQDRVMALACHRRDDIGTRGQSLRHRQVPNTQRGTKKNKLVGIHDLLARSIEESATGHRFLQIEPSGLWSKVAVGPPTRS